MIKTLSGNDWQLEGYLPDNFVWNRESGVDFPMEPFIQSFPASVPGSVHWDLYRTGKIKHPYVDFGALECEWVENKEWRYFKTFSVDDETLAMHNDLLFDGLNCDARMYLNGKLLGTSENVHLSLRYNVDGILKKDNLVEVCLEHQQQDEAQMGSTKRCDKQTQRFGYSWDFCTRLVGVGVWKDVKLQSYKAARFENVFVSSDGDEKSGTIRIKATTAGADNNRIKISINGPDGKTVLSKELNENGALDYTAEIQDPRLWYPLGYGEQPLYTVSLRLMQGDFVDDEAEYKVGIRRLAYVKNTDSPQDAVAYTVVVNGKPIYCNGVNFIPMDHMLGLMSRKRYDDNFLALTQCNVNHIRLWGGGVKENEYFFELCDRYGILVWQDFTQSNSALDGIPNTSETFLTKLRESTVQILQLCRNHTCVVQYTGGNELMDEARNQITFSDKNIQTLENLVKKYDGGKIFYSSSPSGPDTRLPKEQIVNPLETRYDAHGQWGYMGKELHYEWYAKQTHLYLSEFGVNGVSDEDSIARFLSEKYFTGYKTQDEMCVFRNGRWWNSYPRDCELFGAKNVDTLPGLVAASQMIQAEGIKYVIEQNRNRAFACSGQDIWIFGEPWPNINGGHIVDYYMRPKQAYYAVKEAHRPQNINLTFSKIYYTQGETTDFAVNVSNLADGMNGCEAKVTVRSEKEILFQKKYALDLACGKTKIDGVQLKVDEKFDANFFVLLELTDANGKNLSKNTYVFCTDKEKLYAPLFEMKPKIRALFDEKSGIVEIENVGERAALYLNLYCDESAGTSFGQNFITLFAGEKISVAVKNTGGQKVKLKDFTRTVSMTL